MLLEADKLRVKFPEGNRLNPRGDRGHQGVVFLVEPGEDVGHHLLIFESAASRRKFFSEPLHLGVVISDRGGAF